MWVVGISLLTPLPLSPSQSLHCMMTAESDVGLFSFISFFDSSYAC